MLRAAILAFACLGLLAQAAPAFAAPAQGSVVMYSDEGDYVGAGVPRMFTSGLSASLSPSMLDVEVHSGSDWFSLWFAPPAGTTLAPGVYDDAQRTISQAAGHPGIDIDGDGRGCNTTAGRFEVRDLAV